MKKHEIATDQLLGIASEIGEVDYCWLVDELEQLAALENPSDEYKQGILEASDLTWDEFVFIWRNYHIYRIAKRLWRKFERLAKKYPNFDTIIQEIEE